ncbi:hypothetical protein Saa2_05972 [Streptomyces acidiscabies]|nr:hypothetical protein Saa2_05972 [Streptomyces acidiscabies]
MGAALLGVEGRGGQAGAEDAEEEAGEDVGRVELAGVVGVGEDQVRAEHGHGEGESGVRFPEQDLAGPLARAVPGGVRVGQGTLGDRLPDIGRLVQRGGDRRRRDVYERLDPRREREADQLGGADDVRAEELLVRQDMVDQRRRVGDQVDVLGEAPPRLPGQPQALRSDVPGEHIEPPGRQLAVAAQEFRVTGVERRVQPGPRVRVVLAAYDADEATAAGREPLQPVETHEPAEVAVGAGEEDGPRCFTARRGELSGAVQRPRVEELLQREVTGPYDRAAHAVHRGERRTARPRRAPRLDVGSEGAQVVRGAQDRADRHLHPEDLGEQRREGQRGERVAAEVGEARVGGRTPQQRAGGQLDRLGHRPPGALVAQDAHRVLLVPRQLLVQRLQSLPVPRLEAGRQVLAGVAEQAVGQRERLGLDEERARYLVRVQLRFPRGLLEGGGEILVGAVLPRRHDHRQQVGAFAVAVHVDLPDQRMRDVHAFEAGEGDELALGELDDVVAAVDVHVLVGADLGHDVAGAVEAVRVEGGGRHLGAAVVTGRQGRRLEDQLAARIRRVGGEVAEFGDVDELDVGHRGALDAGVEEDRAGLGGAVAVEDGQVEAGAHELAQLGGEGRAAVQRLDEPAADEPLPQVRLHGRVERLGVRELPCTPG